MHHKWSCHGSDASDSRRNLVNLTSAIIMALMGLKGGSLGLFAKRPLMLTI